MSSGTYIILGGGFSVSGNASVTGSNIFIFNAGSNYSNNGSTITTGGNFGGITLSGNGNFNLTPTTGSDPYAGILIYQARDNTRALSISGNATVAVSGTIYAANAALTLSGNGTLKDTLVVGSLNVSGNIALTQIAAGSGGSEAATGFANTLLAGDLALYVNNHSGVVTPDMLARIHDAISSIDVLLAPYSVKIVEVSDPTMATVILDYSSMSANGTAADGVLGSYDPSVNPVRITILQGWNWYTGADAAGAATNQYDFQTTVTHEFGHALGLGHSHDAASPMNENLATGTAHRFMSVADLNIPSTPEGAEPLMAANVLVPAVAVPIEASSRQTLLNRFSTPIFAFPNANVGSGSEQHRNSLQSMALKSVLAEWTSTFGRRDNIEVNDDYLSKTGIAAKIDSAFDDNVRADLSVETGVDRYFANIESDFSLALDHVKDWKSIDIKKAVKK